VATVRNAPFAAQSADTRCGASDGNPRGCTEVEKERAVGTTLLSAVVAESVAPPGRPLTVLVPSGPVADVERLSRASA
jgi:hypothetical protein